MATEQFRGPMTTADSQVERRLVVDANPKKAMWAKKRKNLKTRVWNSFKKKSYG